jgi:hypothetical protein
VESSDVIEIQLEIERVVVPVVEEAWSSFVQMRRKNWPQNLVD